MLRGAKRISGRRRDSRRLSNERSRGDAVQSECPAGQPAAVRNSSPLSAPAPIPAQLKLDQTDLRILSELQRSGRMTSAGLASAVNLSLTPCLTRVKRLETADLISGYSADIDLNKLGSFVTVFAQVTFLDHSTGSFSRFESRIKKIDEITECHFISAEYNYLLKVIARDLGHYQVIIDALLDGGFAIEKCFSYVVIKSPVINRHRAIQHLFGDQE